MGEGQQCHQSDGKNWQAPGQSGEQPGSHDDRCCNCWVSQNKENGNGQPDEEEADDRQSRDAATRGVAARQGQAGDDSPEGSPS